MKNFLKFYKNNEILNLNLLKKIKKKNLKSKFNLNYVEKISINIFRQLVKILNSKHNLNESEKFWKIYLYPWVFMNISNTVDRYLLVKENLHLKVGFKKKINLSKILYENSEYYHKKFSEDPSTNFNFCNLIFNILKKKKIIFYNPSKPKNINKILYHQIFLLKIYKFLAPSNFVFRSYGIKSMILNILNYRSLILPNIYFNQNKKLDLSFRKKINIKISNNDELTKIIITTLPYLIPKSFIEDFKNIKKNIDCYFPKKVKNIYSESSILTQDTIRLWAAVQNNNDTKLNIFQHGGAYTDKINSAVYLEYYISDKHIVFGKKFKQKQKQYTDKIFLRIQNSNKPKNNKILMPISFVSNFNKHYEFPRSSDYIFYYREIFNFLENLNDNVSNKLVLRLMPNLPKKNFFIKILNKNFPNIYYEIPEDNINTSFKNYSFFIGSINSTTILQAMLSGIPLIMFLHKDYFIPNHNFKKYYEFLKKKHILFNNGKSAASFLNNKFENKNFWYSASIKNARKYFIKNILYNKYKL